MCLSTKARILDAAEEIMLAKSFHSVGLNEILAAVKVPKGSFYHYFASKEQFGVELLRHYVAEHSARLRNVLIHSREISAYDRLCAFFDGFVRQLMEGRCKQSCLVSKLGAEVASFSEPMRQVLADGIREWRGIYEQVVREGQQTSCIRKSLDPVLTAELIQDLWNGAVQRASLERGIAPVRNAAAFLKAYLAP